DHIGVDRYAAIDRAPHFMHAWTVTFVNRNLRDLRHASTEAFDNSYAPRALVDRAGAGPSGQRRNRAQHARRARRLAHHFEASGHRIFASGLQELVDETFDRIARMGVPDRAPRQDRHGGIGRVEVAAKVGNVVGNVTRAFDRVRVDAVL